MTENKESKLFEIFNALPSQEALYQEIMEWGKRLPAFPEEQKQEENRVEGCQSLLYLHTTCKGDSLHFQVDSDALISKGLAALLIYYYEGMTAAEVLTKKPTFLETLGIVQSLSPTRAGGVASLYLKMRKQALSFLHVYQS